MRWRYQRYLHDYLACVKAVDENVGKLLDALEAEGVADNTLVVLSSDQGFYLGEHAWFDKRWIYEESLTTPFFARWPGRVPAGRTSDQLLCHTDLLATMAELLGERLPADAGEDSVSLLPALLGRDQAPRREAVVHHSINGAFAIRQGAWKLAFAPGSGGWGKPGDAEARRAGLPAVQLYNLEQDLAETRNLQAEQPAVVARLTALLEDYVTRGRSTPGAPRTNDVPVSWR